MMKRIRTNFPDMQWPFRLAVAVCSLTYAEAAFVNPLAGNLDVHDPVMAKEGNTYYVFWTGDFIKRKTSVDRTTWKNAGTVFGSSAPSWFTTYVPDNNGRNIWAPDISFHNGKWRLYYSVSTFGSRVSAIGCVVNSTLNSSDPNYQWIDEGMVIHSTTSNDYNCIDPNVFQDIDSTLWLVFGSWSSGIKLIPLDPKTGKPPSGTAPIVTSVASHSSGIEGAFLLQWRNYYYLFVSWDNCCKGVNSNYKIVVGRASTIKGPYVDKKGRRMTSGAGEVLDTGDGVRKGPGHNGIFIEHDTVFCINHYYDAARNGAATMQIRPLYWDENHWPSLQPLTGAGRLRPPFTSGFTVTSSLAIRLIGKDAGRYNNVHSHLFTFRGQRVNLASVRAQPMQVYIEKN